jgi:hypothetical protein
VVCSLTTLHLPRTFLVSPKKLTLVSEGAHCGADICLTAAASFLASGTSDRPGGSGDSSICVEDQTKIRVERKHTHFVFGLSSVVSIGVALFSDEIGSIIAGGTLAASAMKNAL